MFGEEHRSFSVIGWKNTGKTSLLCALIPHLGGIVRVCKVHGSYLSSRRNSDTRKFEKAGAAGTLLLPLQEKQKLGLIAPSESFSFPGQENFRLYEGVLVHGSLTAVMYTRGSIAEGCKPGHEHAGLLIHDGDRETIKFLAGTASRDQVLCHRDNIPAILKLLESQ